MRSSLQELASTFEKDRGIRLHTKFAGVQELKRQIDAGEHFDVAIMTPDLIDMLFEQGKIITESRIRIARSGLGVAVRGGQRMPGICSVESFRRVLLEASSVMYASDSAVTMHIERMFNRLGIAAIAREKSIRVPTGGHIGTAIAEGAAECGLTHIPVILESKGVNLLGPFPKELQFYVDFSSGVSTRAPNCKISKALVRHLMTSEATEIMKSKGLVRDRPGFWTKNFAR